MILKATRLFSEIPKRIERSIKDATFFREQVPDMFDKAMSAAYPASFQPNLSQLDAVTKSLKLKP